MNPHRFKVIIAFEFITNFGPSTATISLACPFCESAWFWYPETIRNLNDLKCSKCNQNIDMTVILESALDS